jgi:cytochrome P450
VLVRVSNGLPAGPPSRSLTTLRFARDPYGTFFDAKRRYGDPFTLKLLGSRVVVTGKPDLVRAMFALPPDKVGGLLGHLMPEILGPTSVLVRSGAPHSEDRKVLMPMFREDRVGVHHGVIEEVTREVLAQHAPGSTLPAYELGRDIALNVVLRAMFGVSDRAQLEAFRVAVLNFVEAGSPPLIFYPALRKSFGGVGPWAKVERRMAELDGLFYAQIARRRAEGEGGDDLLGQLIAARRPDGAPLTDLELRDQLMSFVLAGHETMAVTLAWALFWTLSLPAVRARLEAELAGSGDDVAGLEYLDAVCRETLRIYPIQPIVMRHLLEPVTFAGHELPAGAFIGVAATLVHMDPSIFTDSESFKPERFIEARKARPAGEYFPFGGGARRCIGAAMATQEMKTVLAVLLRDHRLRLLDTATPAPVRVSTVTGPRGGVPLVYDGPR